MSCSVCCSKYTLHLLNAVDLVLGLGVLLCGLLLFLKWQMLSLIWLWAPLIAIGGISVLLVFTRSGLHPASRFHPPFRPLELKRRRD